MRNNGKTNELAVEYSDTQGDRRTVDFERLIEIGRDLLIAIGEDPDRPGIVDTPRRFAKWWREFIEYDPGKIHTAFESSNLDQMIVVSGMRVWSLCEHHLLPFWCDVTIGYIPNGKVLGLSKFARIAHMVAHRPQIQERMVEEIAEVVKQITDSESVAVLGSGEHMCMKMRGIKTDGVMRTSVLSGLFREDASARAEFLRWCQLPTN